MNNVELVIFDMDGLIFNTEVLSYKGWLKAAKEFNVNFDMNTMYKLLGTNKEQIKETLLGEYGKEFKVDEFFEARSLEYRRLITTVDVETKPGLHELLNYLDNKNVKKAVATSSKRETAYILLEKANILERFDYVLCGDEVTKSKPDPEVFLNVANKFNIKPEECLVLEDSEAGVIAAYRGNMRVIVIPDLKEPSEEIVKLAYKKVDNLNEVIDEL